MGSIGNDAQNPRTFGGVVKTPRGYGLGVWCIQWSACATGTVAPGVERGKAKCHGLESAETSGKT